MARPRLLLLLFAVMLAVLTSSRGPRTNPALMARQVRPPSPVRAVPPNEEPALSTEVMSTRPVARISSGTVITDKPPQGWTHLVLLVLPRLGSGDVSAMPSIAASYTRMFQLTILARTKTEPVAGRMRHALDEVAIGYAVDIKDRKVVIASGQTQGANLDFIGSRVFEENERMLGELLEVGRSRTVRIFDAPAIVLRDGRHARMIYRHLIQVDPESGKLTVLVWLMEPGRGEHKPVDAAVLLPPDLREDRVLNVKKEKISVLGIPAPDALALVQLPKEGQPIPFTPTFQQAAAHERYSPATLAQLEAAVREAVRSAPVIQRD